MPGPKGDVVRTDPKERRAGRPKAREIVMRVLYECSVSGDDARASLELAFGRFRFTEDGRAYAERLMEECLRHRRKITNTLTGALENWALPRVALIEQAILVLAAAELLFVKETPARVCLDEALRLAHRYGDDATPGFVNGVLDSVAHRARKAELSA